MKILPITINNMSNKGTVKFFNNSKGFGFIKEENTGGGNHGGGMPGMM